MREAVSDMPAPEYYDCYDDGKWIGCGTSAYWAEQLGIAQGQVSKTAAKCHRFKGRYMFSMVRNQIEKKDVQNRDWIGEWCREWDATTAKLRKSHSAGFWK